MSKGFLKLGNQFGIDPNINPDPPSVNNPFFLDTNGVTIKLKDGFEVGTTGQADGDTSGKIYTAVDNTALFALDPATDDYTTVCTTLCTDLSSLFFNTTFNQDIGNWDVSNVTNMQEMFRDTPFNQNISNWNVGNVINMRGVFNGATSFNQDIGSWNTSNVTNMQGMFNGATSFNQNISNWQIISVTDFRTFMFNSAFSTPNYDAILVGWEATLQSNFPSGAGYPTNIIINFGNSQYTLGSAAETARRSLINTFSITIQDEGGI